MPSTSTSPARVAPETVSQAGAGVLLAAAAIAELVLASPHADWWFRCGALLVATLGLAFLARAVAEVVAPLRPKLARRLPRWEPAAPPNPVPIALADPLRR